MIVIGVTGGTGAGKTTFLDAVKRNGGTALDCDALYAELLHTDAALRRELSDAFGGIFAPDGSLLRQKLAEAVFSSPEKLERLNGIVYGHILRAADAALSEARGKNAPYFAIDAINLVQSGLADRCDAVVGVLAPERDRLARIMARDGISEEAAQRRIRAQENERFFRENCTHLLINEGSEADFAAASEALFQQIKKENTV